jgi:iron complex outermembrane receptor protein
MKKLSNRKKGFWFCLWITTALLWLIPSIANAQSKNVAGVVVDEKNEPIIGGVVRVQGTTAGTVTDLDGMYSIDLPEGSNQLEFSFLGYETQIVTVGDKQRINIQFQPDTQLLGELVVIGYGTQRKKDLTGSIASISSKEFNTGLLSSPEQLINGKVAGVQIMSNSGSPTAGSTIRIRGGASLSASNDPLIVLDGVPLETGGISGNSNNFLSLINPNDIENITILKDASSTAIYGSRASSGVMLITTKKGSGDMKVNFSSLLSMQQPLSVCDMLSSEQFRDVVTKYGTDGQRSLLGNTSTDWTGEVFSPAFGSDNNLSVTGKLAPAFPFRASIGYYNQNGTLATDYADRVTGGIALSPSFLDDHLKLTLNVKGAINNNVFATTDAVWAAATFNPTQPVYSGNNLYGGYYESLNDAGLPIDAANRNPVGLLNQRDDKSAVYRSVGNLDVDYKFHFLPDLKAHITLGYDYAKGEGSGYIPAEAAEAFVTGGSKWSYSETKTNKLFTSYLNYTKTFADKHAFDATAGYDYQFWDAERPEYTSYNIAGEKQSSSSPVYQAHVLLSFYGRLNYIYDSKYMFTAALRRDGTSRFNPDNRWGSFPSLAIAWRMSEENFLKEVRAISDLKLRLSYGVTAQQDGIGNYSYLPVYSQGNEYAQYRFGNSYYNVYRPSVYINDLKWETTEAFNYGLDYGFLNNRISGSFDYYTRKTKDLLAYVPVAAGSNFGQSATTNVGNIESKGFEFSINGIIMERKDWNVTIGFNATHQSTKVTNLSLVKDENSIGTYAGPSVSGRGIQILTEGYEPYMFYVYKQIYNSDGKPIEGMYANLYDDNELNEKDLYRYHSPAPDWMFGGSFNLIYKRWNAGFSLRSHVGNYVFNNMRMDIGALETLQYLGGELNNLSSDFLNTGFRSRQFYSDYYVENASFLKMDNLSIGYDCGKVFNAAKLRLGLLVQNVFTITGYSGKDPELPNGFDNAFYPRSRTYSFNINLEF